MEEDYEYDFAYECRRLVEAMAPRSARSFRQEFNMQDLTTEHTYTSHYTTEKYVRTSHSTELDGQPVIKSMTNGKLNSPNYTTKTIITEDDRPDVRKLKRVHRMYEGPNIIESKGILHPETREILTVGQAISMRILDVRTGRLLSAPDTRQTMTIEQAAQEGLIDPKLAARLTGPCGMTEDGNEVTLLEAIQRELYDAEQGLSDPAEKRIKVTVEGEQSSQGMSISDALNRGQVDLQRGLYRLPNGSYITIAEAYQRGYLIYNEIIKIKSSALCLSDAISQDLVDNSGWILDRNSGDRYQIDIAIQNELINPNIREVVDPKNDTKVTLAEAIEKNIINTKHSKYIHTVTKEKLTFKDAAIKRYICKPMTLKDVCDNNLMTNDGKILSPANRAPLNILEAISAGVLDSDNVKCITNTTTGGLLTLSEALGAKIILHDNKFRDNLTGEICTIPEAVDRGLITSVSQRSIFDIDGFKDPKTGEFVSFNIALSKGNLKYVNGETFLKSETGDWVFLEDCTKVSLVRAEVLEMFNRKIGVYENGKELSVLDAVFKNVLDPKTGHLLDSTTKRPIPFNKAVEINMITPEGAALLNSLLNITLTLQTVTKTVKRYVTVTNTSATQRSETIITFAEAIRRGLIDENTQTFTDPTTGTVFPIQQALDEGLLGVEKNEPRVVHISDRVSKKDLVPGQVVELKITKKSYIKDLPPSPEGKVQRDSSRPETVKSPDFAIHEMQPREGMVQEIRTVTSKSVVSEPTVTSMTIKKNTIELPRGGWTLKEAIQQNLFDPTTGMFIIPGTDRVLDLEEAIKINIVNGDSANVVDPKSRKEVPLYRALESRIIDSTGHYKHKTEIITMKEAIERRFITFIQLTSTTHSQKVITITSVAGMPDKMEISEMYDTPSHETISEDQSALEPVQVTPGVIFDPATALVISTSSGVSENVLEAVDRGILPANSVKVIEPQSGRPISLKQAVDKGIVNPKTGEYTDKTGKRITLVDAAKIGLVAVVGAPLVAASKVIQVVKSTMVVDPQTGENLPMEVAYERGLVDPITYKKYEESIRDRTPDMEVTEEVKTSSTSIVTYSQVTTTKTLPSETTITVVVDPKTGEKLPIDVAYERGLIDPVSYKKYELSIKEKSPDFEQRLISSPSSSGVTFTQVSSVTTPDKMVTMVVDPKTGEQLPIEVAYEKGILDPITYKIYQDAVAIKQQEVQPVTGKTVPGTSTVTISQVSKPVSVGAAVSEGFITVESIQNSLSADNRRVIESPTTTDKTKTKPTDVVQIIKSTISTKPKYKVNIGREQTPEAQVLEKPVVLQKLRKHVVTPLEAVEQGLVDKETAKILESVRVYKDESGSPITLEIAIEKGIIDENKGKIVDPVRGDVLTIKEAIKRGILDIEGQDEVLIPLARSLTIPEVLEQGLLDPVTGKIVHPETGSLLTLREAIICDIVDPLSSITLAPGKKITLAEAVERNIIDNDKNVVKTSDGPLDFVSAVNAQVFSDSEIKPIIDIPPAAMTLNIAIKKNLINPHTGEMKHPLTGEMTPVGDAVKKDLIMAIPYPQTSETITLEEALDKGAVNLKQATFTDPKSKEVIPLDKALEKGLLAVKPMTDMQATGIITTTTETFTSQHTVTTKMIELLADYVLVSSNEVQNTKTGEIISIDEARRQGIIRDEQTSKEQFTTNDTNFSFEDALNLGYINIETGTFTHPKTGETVTISEAVTTGLLNTEVPSESGKSSPKKQVLEMLDLNEAFELLFDEKTQKFRDPKSPNKVLTFKEALDKKIINPDSVIYNVEAGKPVTLKEALNSGLIDKKTGKLKEPKTGKSLDIKNAAKMGLIAVVAAPVLAGMAVVQGAKSVTSKIMQPKQEQAVESSSRIVTSEKTTVYEPVGHDKDKKSSDKDKRPIVSDVHKPGKVDDKPQKSSPQTPTAAEQTPITVSKTVTVTKKPDAYDIQEELVASQDTTVTENVVIEKTTIVTSKDEKPEDERLKQKPKSIKEAKPDQPSTDLVTEQTTVTEVLKKPKELVPKDVDTTKGKHIAEKPSPTVDMEHVVFEEKPVIQEFTERTAEGEEVVTVTKTTVTKTIYDTAEEAVPSDKQDQSPTSLPQPGKERTPTSESKTVVQEKTTVVTSAPEQTTVKPADTQILPSQRPEDLSSKPGYSFTKFDDGPTIEEIHEVTPDGKEITRIVKTTVSKSEPTEFITEHSSTVITSSSSTFTTVEITQNESSSYQVVTEETSGPQDYTETVIQEYQVTEAPDEPDDVQATRQYKVSPPSEKEEGTDKDSALPKGVLPTDKVKEVTEPKEKPAKIQKDLEPEKPVEVAPGVIYDPNTSVVISAKEGVADNLLEAVNKGIVPADTVKVVEPKTGKEITLKEAIKKGVVDSKTGEIKDKSGKKISIGDAAKIGLIAVVGAPILAAAKVVQVVKNAVVVDPKTGEKLPLDEAREKGLVDPDTYKKYEQLIKTTTPEEITTVSYDVTTTQGPTEVTYTETIIQHGTVTTTHTIQELSSQTTESPTTVISEITTSTVPEQKMIGVGKTTPIITVNDGKSVSAMLIDAERQPLRVIEEITEQNVTKEKSEPIKPLYENIQLIDAIAQGKIEPKVCRIIINGVESPLTVQDSLEQEQISRFAPVDVISKNCVVVKELKPSYSVAISQRLTPEELSEMGVYDIEKQVFLNPETGAKITFEELVYGLQIFDPETLLVKDLGSKSDDYISFDEAIARPIIDKTTGHMVNPKTGKRVPFLECVQLGWIVEKPEDVSIPEQVTIESALEQGLYNAKTGEIKDVNTGALVPIGQAIEKGLVDQESLLIKVPRTNEIISLSDAIERNIIEIHEGVITIVETREIIEISVAIQRGFITVIRRPISIEAVIENDMYEPKTGKIKDKVTEQLVSVGDAVDRNIVHPTISEIKDTALEKFVPLSEALDTKLIDPETGKIKDKKTGKDIPLDDALKKGLVATKAVTFSLFDIIELGYYSPETGKVMNPRTGQFITLKDAIQDKLVDPSEVKIKDDKSEAVVPFDKAVKSGLIDLEKGVITSPLCNLKDACDKGYLLSDKKPWSLQEGLVQGFYDPETGLLTINDVTMTLEDAIKIGNINPEALTVRNSVTGEIISLADAIKVGIVDSKEGKVRDPIYGDKISLTDASERGLIVPAKRKLSLPEAVFKGFYDPKTGKFSNPLSKEKIPTDRAIKKRLIDPQSTLVHAAGKVIPFEFAVDRGIVDSRTGTIRLGDENIDFREAFERGILVEVRKPMSLIEALEKGVYNEITGLFMDPQSGKKYTLVEAIKMGLVDAHSVHILDNRLGKWDKITLPESLETGVIDDQTGKIRNINSDNEEISLRKAFEIGLLVDSKAPISLQRALHQGLYDDSTGKIIDPATNRKITLHEAIRRSIISPKYLCYFDKKSEKPLSLGDCCRSEIIDRRSGKFHEPGSDVAISLSEAMSLGLIVDIESAGFTLYEALAMNMYSINELAFIHPVSERPITLKTAIAEELINPETSLVKHIPSSKYIKLTEAIESGIIDDENSIYILPNGNQINLLDAKHRGLIVTTKKNLSLEEIIRNGLFRADNGKIVDPSTNEFIDINKAIEINLLNPDLTVVKDNFTNKFKPLPNAIQQGDVDVSKGRVIDTKAKKTYSLDIAFDKGLLVTVIQPITSQTAKKHVTESLASKEPTLREFTLDEAIKYEFIDPETAVIKDPHKNKYIPLKLGITEGIIDKNAKGSFDTQNRSRTLCFVFENGLIVYVREPLTFEQAIEEGHLNIATARFTDPHSNEVLTIRDAAALGYIDPDTALIKDNLKKRLVKLPEAFRKGLMDAEKGNILDTETSKLNTLTAAIESGLLMTPKKSFSLIETLNFGIYNPTTGALNDPFITTSVMDRKRLNLGEAIAQGIVDPSSTVVKEPETGKIMPLVQAMEQKLVDPVEGRLTIDPVKSISLDLVKALKKGYLLPAETRQAVEEKYRLCDETLSKLLEWIAVVEERLANQEAVKEDMDELRNQINILKLIKDDLESHQRQVSACADQAKQLLVSGGDVLAPHEVAALERGVRQLKQRCDKCTDKCDKMLRRLAAARDELGKFSNELNAFNTWMESAYRTLEDKEAALSKLNSLPDQSEDVREFVSDVIAHQADLRFITMSAQKFVDESKEFLSILNEYRTSLPSRLSHIAPRGDSAVREGAGSARRRHADLCARAQRLQDRLRGAADVTRHYHDALQRAGRWISEVEPQVNSALSEPVGGEPRAVESQLSKAKALHNEIISQGRLIDNAKDACENLVKSLEGNLTPSEIRQLEVPVLDLTARYKDIVEGIGSRCSELEAALLQCQGLQDAAETQAHWVGQAESLFKSQQKPASLIRERLDEQMREQRIAIGELEARRPTLAKLLASARQAALTPSNARIAKKLEQRADDIYARYEKLLERSSKRGEFLEEVSSELAQFTAQASTLDAAYSQLIEQADTRELARMPAEEIGGRLTQLAQFRDKQMPLLEECLRNGKQLISKKDVTDTHVIRDRMKALENQWRDFNATLEEKQKLSKQRADQLNQYESLKIQVLDWLQSMENRVTRLQPVAVDLDVIKQQQDELRPLAKEYRDFSITIDKVNEAGAVYEALTRGDRADSPHRKRQIYSPTKRQTPSRTLDGRSPSPSKGHGLVSPGSTHSTSSGFSSRRSSQDGFHLEELSPVQQQLSEINNRYSLLGTKLSDRTAELDAVREELRKHLDSLRALNTFLDKVQRQLPKESVPNTKEEADKTIKQARAVLEEMYEKQSILDSTKTQVRELLKRKQSVLGADRLHDEMEDVASRWKALHDAFKDKIRLMEEMKDFHDTHSNLSQWLLAKDRMMAALGPISSDSRMVQTQVQQVQVLREEFRGQQPQLAHLEEVGAAVLDRLEPSSPDANKLRQKVTDVQDRWNDLLNKLEQRADSLGAMADTSREFDAGLARLRDALHAIADKLDDTATETEPDELLRKIENLERQLEGQRPLLADLEGAGAALAQVLSDPSSRQDIQSKLAAVARQYDNLQRKLDHRKAEIEAALKDGRNLEENVARTLGWLQSELNSLPSRLQVSADATKLQQQLERHEPLYRELTQREHELIMLLDKGREMEKKPAHQNLRKDLDRIQTQWDKLKRETVDRHTRLQTAMEHCRKFHKAQESFVPWLSDLEDRLAKLPATAFTKKEVEKQLRELQQIRNDIWKRSGEYENNKTLGETFISACDVDQDVVRKLLDSMKERWDRINNEVLQQVEFLETTARKLGEFAERVRAVDTPLQRCEERLQEALAAPPAQAAEAVARLADQIHALRAPLQSINSAADDIVSLALECSGRDAASRAREVLEEQAQALADRLEDLEARAGDAKGKMAGAAAAMTLFQDKVKNLSHDLSDLEKELDGMKPPGRDIKTVRQQLDDIGRFYKRLEKADDLVGDTERAAETLVDSGYTVDSAKTRDQVEGLRKQLAKLDERARSKEQDLDDTLSKLEAFYKAYDSVMDDVSEAAEQVRSLKPVSSEVEQIRSQQKDFAELKRRTLEPLGQNVAHCNKIGQGLVRSALQGVNTQVLEKDLEKMNDKWNALKEKMNERERRLDVGLLQSGKFAEALAGLEKWLADTEDMVNNQKPPSADYKVVKAQLQEQKFLKKMLMDRQNSMSSLFAMGNEVAGGCEAAERKAIEKQLKGLMQRFDALTNGAQQRMLDLEQAMMVAKQFQEELQPLVEWLGTTERKVKSLQLVPTDEEKIQHKIREHKNLHEDIISKQPAFKQLTETASTLMGLVGDDEATALADRLQAATDRYQALVDHSLNIGDLLEASRKGLRHLVLTYQDLSAWMDSMEQYLAKRKILPVHMEKLLRQMDELAEKTEEIASKQEAVDSTVESGLELMKHISGDEALQLKDKLDALQRRYNDLTSRGAELLRVASETLPLVQQLYNSHGRLTDWMAGAESCLQSVEPREEDILRLEAELQEYRPVLENINQIGPQLCQISPGEGATHIESIVTRDNRRFDAIAEQVQRKAERLLLSKKRSLEVVGDMEEVLEWLRGVDSALRAAEPPSCDAPTVRAQLKEQRPLSDDVAAQRVRVRDLLSQAKKVLRECQSSEETAVIRDRSEELKEMMEEVGHLSAERLAALEQALPLAEHFADTHHGLSSWLDDMEKQIQMLAMPALRPEQIVQQQDKNEMLQQSINNHKPLVDKLVKTGEALSKLCGDDDAAKVQDIVDGDCERYNALRAELRQRQQELEQALQESSQFSDKLEGMLRALSGAADQLHRAEPVSAHPPKIEDQIDENNALVEDLEKRTEAYNAVQRAASDVISKANKSDPAVRDIRNKLDKLNKLWGDVQKASSERGNSLDATLEVSRRFWAALHAVMAQLGELEDTLCAQAPPAAQPRAIQAQQVALQEIRHEIDHTKPEVEKVRKTGSTLMSLCGEPDKPEVKKHMEDLDSAWDNITALYARREENLIDAMEKAMEFHDTLQNLQEFLDSAEDKFSRMGPLGSDIDAVKRQIAQLASFKQEVDPHMVKVEALNRSLMRQAQELTERTSSEQAAAIKAPLTEVNSRWSALLRGMVERQQQLERALLRLGQLQHALQELLSWIENTSATLDTLKPVAGDPQILEVELAKLKVLVNDIAAHQASVDTLNDAGAQIVQQGTGTDEAGETAEKLATLNRKWRELQQKARDRQTELEDALREAQSFNAEIGDLLSWLSEVDSVIAASKPVGGLPETASEQLERFMEVYNEIEANRPKVEAVLQQGQEYLKKQERPNPTSQLHHNLKNLKSRWDNVTARASDKKIKLEIALKEATEFHDALQAFVDWLTSAEKTLTSAKPVSRVMETLLTQIEEHKSFQKEVATHRETMLHLDKKGTHLKYFSQKQDVILIKNLLVSVQHRWERVVSKAAERTRALDHGFKEAKEYNDMWHNLMNWLNDTEQQLDTFNAEATVNDPEKIKQRLTKHREFQKALAAKQPVYDQTMKTGKQLKDKAPKGDENTLKTMMSDMKTKWTTVCSKAVDRQRKLEEALLYSGQFKDAMSALLDWLKKQQKELGQDSPVHGDLDTVMALIEQHKQFEEDLHSREQQMHSVMKTGKDLEATVPREDAASIRQQCSELKTAWEAVQSLSEKKAHKLETALKEAEKLHRSVNMLLEWLSDAETKLRFSGQLPEGDQETQQQIREHERFVRELNEKQRDKDDTITLAHSILSKAHPDAVTVIKHWITIIQSRWDEVWQWAMQRGSKLETHMQSLKDLDLVLEELLQWLIGLENTLLSLESEPLPESIELLEGLIEDHKELMEHTQKRQNEVDRVCKAYQVKSQSQGRESTPRKVSAKTATKGAPGRGSQHDLNRERSVSPDYYGSRRFSRVSPGRETPDRNLPHYGPRFPAKGSSKGAEPEFRSPRVKQLWDKWRTVWLLAWERQRRLHERLMHLKELQRVSNFSWDDWRKRFLKFMNHKKSRLTDLFRKMDKDNNGLIPRHEFIDGIINTKFDTSRLEMGAVADLFDRNGGGLIDWEEFIAALRPDWVERRGPPTDADKIHDEVKRLVMLCTCRQKFRVFQVGEGKYRFGDSQKLRLVRILRSTVMVRVGGGWVALDEFLVKNDPCRAEEFMEQLRPIFEALRQREELPCSYPLHVGSTHGTKQAFIYGHSRSQGSTTPGAHHYSHHHGYQPSPGYHWVRERTARSVPMSAGVVAGRASRSSLSAGTPDSLSDNEAASGLGARYRKPSVPRSTLTPGGSRPGSRPGSRAGSKPPSRHGSNLSLDSTDDVSTPSRIPMRRVTNTKTSIARAAANASKLGVTTPNGGSRPRTPTGFLTPASGRYATGGMYRTSSIPTLSPVPALVSSTHSQPSSMASEHPKSLSHTHPAFQTQGSTKIPVYVGNRSHRSPSVERRLKISRKSHSRETSQEPSPTSQGPSRKSEQRSPEDDSSLFSISGMTSDNEYESNISESSGEASKPTQRDVKGSGSFASTEGQTPGRSRIPVLKDHHTNSNTNRQRTPSGSTTPVRSGQQTAVTRLMRKPSDSSDAGTPTTPASRRGTPASSRTTEKREPFRL
ncbi:uncharacterized protein LOC124641568 isoform X30 [Helicoverpa zea]|uniref:uncharacterized protein LOC124641568 isoform X30 n=1 Tax=Helicoverpa zea TaxID=7113 RepID=UPI001F55C706|nr:uncharacterized protein LOC124641568 isoform X30 [Helicoverpa zea]